MQVEIDGRPIIVDVKHVSALHVFLRNWMHFIGMVALAAACALVAQNVSMLFVLLGFEILLLTQHQVAEHREQFFATFRVLMMPVGYIMFIVALWAAWHEKRMPNLEEAIVLVSALIVQAGIGYRLVDYVWHDWVHDRVSRKPVLSLASLMFGLAICFGVAIRIRQL